MPVIKLFDLRVLAVFALARGRAARRDRVAFITRVTRRAGAGCVACASLSAERSVSRAASPAGASRGFLVFTGCQMWGDAKALCLRNSRAASS